MAESMASFPEVGPDRHTEALIELSPHARLPRLDLGIDWVAPRQEFRTSLASLFRRSRTQGGGETEGGDLLRVTWIEGRLPVGPLGMSSLWHVALIWLAILPIWGFLPQTTPTLAPVQIEVSWYGEPKDLPPLSLPAAVAKPTPLERPSPAKAADEKGADAFHPRQTIFSVPVHVTHPRQTLIRPDAPNTPPKIVPQLPNIVEWKAPELVQPKFRLSATATAPKIPQRHVQNVTAPEVPNNEKNSGPMNISAKPVVIARPQIPLSAMSQPTTHERATPSDAAAPDVGPTAVKDSGMGNVIALSATPGPPAPLSSVPEGNLAARIAISPEGTKPGEPVAAGSHGGGSPAAGGSGGSRTGLATAGGPAGSSSLPAAVVIAGGAESRPSGGGGIASGAGRSGRPNLTPKESYEPAVNARRGAPIDTSKLAPGLPPEKILSGSEIYTMHVNLPNVTSASGSWILNFAELEEEDQPTYRRKERLQDPVPVHVTDPKYPPELIKGHVHGEVVLYAIIRRNGSVDSIQIVRDLDPELDRNAIDALEKWVFEPATRAGVPVDVEAVIHVPFSYIDPRVYPTTTP